MNWIKSARPITGLSVAMFIVAICHISHIWHNWVWIAAIGGFLAWSTVMAWNDWFDRQSDAKFKGKRFAIDHPVSYVRFCSLLWIAAVVSAILLLPANPLFSLVILAVANIGLIYHKTYRIPCLSAVTVGVLYAAVTTGFALIDKPDIRVMILSLALFCLMVAREIVKDTEDEQEDRERGKRTLVVWLGKEMATKAIIVLVVITITLMVFTGIRQILPLVSLALAIGLLVRLKSCQAASTKLLIDLALASEIITLLFLTS